MTLTHLSASSPAGAEQATAATETDNLGSTTYLVGDEHVVDEVTAASATDALRSYLGIDDADWAHLVEGWETPWYEVVTNYDSSSHAEVNGGDLCWITDISDGDDFARIVARVGLPDREGFTGQPLVVTATRCDA